MMASSVRHLTSLLHIIDPEGNVFQCSQSYSVRESSGLWLIESSGGETTNGRAS